MPNRVSVRPDARIDIYNQAKAISETNLDAAFDFYDAVEETCLLLATMPNMGYAIDSRDPGLQGLRMWAMQRFKKHRIFYIPAGDGIEVVRVLHGHQDYRRFLT